MYKLRDGPVDWWFCDDEHALEWLEWRHRNRATYKILRTGPQERQSLLNGMSIKEYCETSSNAISKAPDAAADV